MIANWKMNGSLEQAHDFCTAFSACAKASNTNNTIVLCPATPYLSFLNGALSGTTISLGAQDCAPAQKGAHTGDTSAEMLHDVGASYVIIGHSERRQHHQESNDLLMQKIIQARQAALTPLFCVGESAQDHEGGRTQDVLKQQLQVLEHFKSVEDLIVAYEPVWAIGTGKVASAADIQRTCDFIKNHLKTYDLTPPILYGGSVKASNAAEILSQPAVTGVLVGGG